jgi:hypothetical protein
MTAPASLQMSGKPASDRPAILSWLPTVVFNIVLPTVTYFVLTSSAHVKPVPALLISGVWPAVELAYTIRRQRHIDEFSVFVLIGIAIGIVTTVFSQDARAVFLKDSISTGLIGLVMLATLFFGRPLTFYLGRRFATDGSRVQRDWWDGLWQHPQFRRTQRLLGAAWGLSLFGEASIRAALTWRLGTSAMVVVNNVVPYVVTILLIFVSITVGRRAKAAAVRRHGAGAGPPVTTSGPVPGA